MVSCDISTNKVLIFGGVIDNAIPGLLDKCEKLNGCETGQCKVTLG